MTRKNLRVKIERFKNSKLDNEQNGRVLSAEMDARVIQSLNLKLEEAISTHTKVKKK